GGCGAPRLGPVVGGGGGRFVRDLQVRAGLAPHGRCCTPPALHLNGFSGVGASLALVAAAAGQGQGEARHQQQRRAKTINHDLSLSPTVVLGPSRATGRGSGAWAERDTRGRGPRGRSPACAAAHQKMNPLVSAVKPSRMPASCCSRYQSVLKTVPVLPTRTAWTDPSAKQNWTMSVWKLLNWRTSASFPVASPQTVGSEPT